MDNIVAEIEEQNAEDLPVRTDVTNEAHLSNLMDQVYQHGRGIDILMNNAGAVTQF
jgi:NADP-dependent 3-hydroxy acid dehydrogenase YdfG